MARLVTKNVRGIDYLQAVEDYKDPITGQWHQKVLRSFGTATPENHFSGVQYVAAVNAFIEQRERQPTNSSEWQPWEKAAAVVLGGVALGWLLSHLFGED